MDAGRTLLWGHLVGFLLLAAWAPFDPAAPALSAMGAGVGAGLFGLGGLFFLYTGLARGRAAVVAPTAAVVGAVVPVVFGVLAGDSPGLTGWIGVVVAMPAIYLVSRVDGLARRAAGLGYGVAAGALFGGYFVLLALASGETGLGPLLASRAVTTALLASVAVAGKRDWIRPPSGTTAGAVIGVGALDVVGNIGYLLAAGVGNLVMVAVVASLYPAVTVALARIVYDESLSGPQLAGVMLALASVACFSIP